MTLRHFTLATFFAGGAFGQVVAPSEDRGAFSTIPHFLSASPALPAALKLAWKPDFDLLPGTLPFPASPMPGSPNYSLAAMFPGVDPNHIELDAISAGSDHIPNLSPTTVSGAPCAGCLNPDLNGGSAGWMAITFSVRRGEAPPDNQINAPDSILEARRNVLGEAYVEGDLYGYFLPSSDISIGPSGIPIALQGLIYLEQGREHMSIPSGSRLACHDAYMPYIQLGAVPNSLIYTNTKFFFSVTANSASQLSLPGPAQVLFGGPVSPGTIYVLEWDGNWKAPEVFRSFTQLGLGAGDDIDALAVRNHPVRGDAVMFSTTTSGPVLWVQGALLPPPQVTPRHEAKDRDGTPIRLIQSGDINGISVYDPEASAPNAYLGFPVNDPLLPTPSYSLSIARSNARVPMLSISNLGDTDVGIMTVWTKIGAQVQMIDSFAVNGGGTVQRRLPPSTGTLVDQEICVVLMPPSGPFKYSWAVAFQR